jgi:LSM domain
MAVQAYDQHLNMILGDVEETITTVEIDDETYEEIIKVHTLYMLNMQMRTEDLACWVFCMLQMRAAPEVPTGM